jgi:diaminohydroxyphosphoribosylaminopyrimidine deaminase/5-amino-6-(5-phosphoribosylamino)uracil reductase
MHDLDSWHMRRALELAGRGVGHVEPNPPVGCVVARGAEIVGEGWHRQFGGPHAEVEALRLAGPRAAGATLVVTLEPCCHLGKTPPCTQAILAAGVRRVVVAQLDPFPAVAGRGVAELRAAGLEVEVGVLQDEAVHLNAPYRKLLATGRPWTIAKWAMTLDGRLATRTGESRWISGPAARQIVHQLRGRMDAIVVGRGTAEADDPLLTARPPGPRVATRVVCDTHGKLSSASRLAGTAREAPVLVAVGPQCAEENRRRLTQAGCEVFECAGENHRARLAALLDELGRRRMTNVLVEGGPQLLGSLLDARALDEVHAFIAPKIVGGAAAPAAILGCGVDRLADALRLEGVEVRTVGEDLYLHGRVASTG